MKKPITHRKLTPLEVNMEFKRIAKLHAEGKIKAAWDAANDLWVNDKKNPVANFAIALIVNEHGEKRDALKFAKTAVDSSPCNVGYNVFIGKLNLDLNIIEDAPFYLERAFLLDPKVYQAPWALAKYYYETGQGAQAVLYFEKAMSAAIDRPVIMRIKGELAACLAAIGRSDEAKVYFDSLEFEGKIDVYGLTRAALLEKNDQHSAYGQKIKARIQLANDSIEDKSELILCLGRLFENGRDFDNAFECFTESRKLKNVPYDHKKIVSEFREMITAFTPDQIKSFANFGDPTSKPIFVVGMPRSGTTMTEQILAGHSMAAGVGELRRMGSMRGSFTESDGYQGLFKKMREVGPKKWLDIPQKYLDLLSVLAPNAKHTIDKMPHNFKNIGFIKLCFPNAKIVHCRRNPLDTFISAFQNSMNEFHNYTYNQADYGAYYLQYLNLMNHWENLFPETIFKSDYEILTANPDIEVRKLLVFLGLPFEEACLNLSERQSTVRTFSREQVRNTINTNSVARWKRYEKHLGPIMEVFEKAGVVI